MEPRRAQRDGEERGGSVKGSSPEEALAGAKYVRSEMERAFPEALVNKQAYTRLIEVVQNDPKDRHVLAAAIVARAETIVTFNIKDFPQEACSPYGIEILHPDEFLVHQASLKPQEVLGALDRMASKRRSPLNSPQGILGVLEKQPPEFCKVVRVLLEGRKKQELIDYLRRNL